MSMDSRPWKCKGEIMTLTILSKSFTMSSMFELPHWTMMAKSITEESLGDSFLNIGINSSCYKNGWFQRTTALFPQSYSVGMTCFLVAAVTDVTVQSVCVSSRYTGKRADRQNQRSLNKCGGPHLPGSSSHPLDSARVIWICKKKKEKIEKKISEKFNWSVFCLILRPWTIIFRERNPQR